MKSHRIATALFAATIALGASAQTSKRETIKLYVPKDVALTATAPSKATNRAEQKADILIWRASGLEALENGEQSPDTNSVQYRQAMAKYEYLRASPQFTTLVEQISQGNKPRVAIVPQ
jgi:hypothetical protein